MPAWSTLSYDDGSGSYRLSRGTVSGYRQQLDLRTGTLTTSLTWTSPAGRQVGLRYDVTPDRARRHAAVVRLRLTPRFSGPVTVTDTLDGQTAELLSPRGTGHQGRSQWVDVSTAGLHVRATEASTLVGGRVRPVRSSNPLTARQAVRLHVRAGHTYTLTKYVGIATASDSRRSHLVALEASRREARIGYAGVRRASDAAWARLWRSDIVVSGDSRLQRQVRSSFFALLASVRQDTPWLHLPAGSRRTATTATSSGTPRRGCMPASSRPSRAWPGRPWSTATTGWARPVPMPAGQAGVERASRGRAH